MGSACQIVCNNIAKMINGVFPPFQGCVMSRNATLEIAISITIIAIDIRYLKCI